jgi:hypothetical protein
VAGADAGLVEVPSLPKRHLTGGGGGGPTAGDVPAGDHKLALVVGATSALQQLEQDDGGPDAGD